jgi:hypothetical protein
MNTRLCTAIGAIALVFALNAASAFACGAGHHTGHKSGATKVSYATPKTAIR